MDSNYKTHKSANVVSDTKSHSNLRVMSIFPPFYLCCLVGAISVINGHNSYTIHKNICKYTFLKFSLIILSMNQYIPFLKNFCH